MNAPSTPEMTAGDAQRAALLRQRLVGIGQTDPRRSTPVPMEDGDDFPPKEGIDPTADRTPRQLRSNSNPKAKRRMRPGQVFAIVLLGLMLAGGAFVLTRESTEQKIEPASVQNFAGPKASPFGRMRVGALEPEPVSQAITVAAPVVTEPVAHPAVNAGTGSPQSNDPDAVVASAEARVLEALARQRTAEAEAAEARLANRGLKGDITRLEALLKRAERDRESALEMQARAHKADLRALRAELEARHAIAPMPASDPVAIEAARLAEEARLRELERLRALRQAQIRSNSLIFDESRPMSQGITY